MSLFSSMTTWCASGMAIELGSSCLRAAAKNQAVVFRDPLMSLVHGVALAIVGKIFGESTAIAAFIATAVVLAPAFLTGNFQNELLMRVGATLIGVGVGFIFERFGPGSNASRQYRAY